jgi:RimJ/RimL family protein N-acetyltransferase
MPQKLLNLFRLRGFRTTLAFVGSRLFRVESHLVFYNDDQNRILDVAWSQGILVVEAASSADLAQLDNYKAALPSSAGEYVDAIRAGQAMGLFVFVDGQLAHWSFLLKQTRTLCYLGYCGRSAALVAAMFTVPSFRGQGLQTRAVLQLTNLAHRSGNKIVVAETSPDNEPSARAMKSGGMKSAGTLHFAVICNRLVVRWKQPFLSTLSIEFCGNRRSAQRRENGAV